MNIEISYPTALDKIKNIYDDKIDVFVKLDDDLSYTLTICTPQHYYTYMEKENLDFVSAGCPDIIVKVLTYDVIEKAVRNFCNNNAYYLKKYAEI